MLGATRCAAYPVNTIALSRALKSAPRSWLGGLPAVTLQLFLVCRMGEGHIGGRRKENSERGNGGGRGVGCPFSCSWLLQSRQVLWSLPSQQATTPNTKVLANGTPSLSERATWFLGLFYTPRRSHKQAFGQWGLDSLSALCICVPPLVLKEQSIDLVKRKPTVLIIHYLVLL